MSVIFTSHKPFTRAENIKAVYDAYQGQKAFAQTENWLCNPDMTGFKVRVADEFITESPGISVIIGHGFGAGKTGGLDQPYPYYSRRYAGLMDYIVTTGRDMVELVARQCGVDPSRVVPLGMPRTDIYFRSKKGDGGTFLAGKRAYLYVPTWRAREETPLPGIDWEYLDSALDDDEILVVKPHPMTGTIMRGSYRHIVEVPSVEPATPYLIDSDVVITDYSSILFDAHLLKKPVILFEKTPGYRTTRGMYFQYPDAYSSRFCETERDLIDLMRDAEEPDDIDLLCVRRVTQACDGHATERVIALLEELTK